MEWCVFEEEINGAKQPVGVLDRGAQSNFAQSFTILGQADASSFGTRVDSEDSHCRYYSRGPSLE
jgi:hypothetical protein